MRRLFWYGVCLAIGVAFGLLIGRKEANPAPLKVGNEVWVTYPTGEVITLPDGTTNRRSKSVHMVVFRTKGQAGMNPGKGELVTLLINDESYHLAEK